MSVVQGAADADHYDFLRTCEHQVRSQRCPAYSMVLVCQPERLFRCIINQVDNMFALISQLSAVFRHCFWVVSTLPAGMVTSWNLWPCHFQGKEIEARLEDEPPVHETHGWALAHEMRGSVVSSDTLYFLFLVGFAAK